MMTKYFSYIVSFAFISLVFFIGLLVCPYPIVHASVTTQGGNTLGSSACTETTATLNWTQSSNPNFSSYSLFFCKPQITSSGAIILPSINDFTQILNTGNQSETSTYVDNLLPNTCSICWNQTKVQVRLAHFSGYKQKAIHN